MADENTYLRGLCRRFAWNAFPRPYNSVRSI